MTPETCADAYAYINDLARNGLVVFSLKQLSAWRISHPSFVYDVGATDFIVARKSGLLGYEEQGSSLKT